MSKKPIVHGEHRLEEIRTVLQQAPLVAIREHLADRSIIDACNQCGHVWRDRLYNPIVTVFHFLAQALQRELSFAATWQELWTPVLAQFRGLFAANWNPSALTHARTRLPLEVMETLAEQACLKAAGLRPFTWRKMRLVALDASTVSMPANPQLFEHFGTHRARSTTVRYPLATFASLLEVGSSLILDYAFGPFDPGEISTATPLLESLAKDHLLLADRHFSNAPFLIKVRQRGADFLMRKNARLIVERLPVLARLGRNDFLTQVPMSKPVRKKYPDLPEKVRARVFRATWRSPDKRKVTEWFVTSLEDPMRFKKSTLARLYHQRWRCETSYEEFKQTFHADVLRSKTVQNVRKEFTAHVLAYQLVRLVMADAARRSGSKPTQISTVNAARWLLSFSRVMARAPARALPGLYAALLDAIASSRIDIRPGRIEPRALTRERKHYPRLRTSRQQYRAKLLRSAS